MNVVTMGYVVQFLSCDGVCWSDWWIDNPARPEGYARDSIKHLKSLYPNVAFRLITRETTVIEHEVKE